MPKSCIMFCNNNFVFKKIKSNQILVLFSIQGLSKKYLTLSPAKNNAMPAKWF